MKTDYELEVDTQKRYLKDSTYAMCKIIEWFCQLDSMVYSAKDTILAEVYNRKLLNEEESEDKDLCIKYYKDFKNDLKDISREFMMPKGKLPKIMIKLYLTEYDDKPIGICDTKTLELELRYNINYFITPDIIPIKVNDTDSPDVLLKNSLQFKDDSLLISKDMDDKWVDFIDKSSKIEEYRQIAISYISNYLSDIIMDQYGTSYANLNDIKNKKLARLIYISNKIISLNTAPCRISTYLSIKAWESLRLNLANNIKAYKTETNGKYIFYKNLYFIIRHQTKFNTSPATIVCKYKNSNIEGISVTYIEELPSYCVYNLLMGVNNILLSGYDT